MKIQRTTEESVSCRVATRSSRGLAWTPGYHKFFFPHSLLTARGDHFILDDMPGDTLGWRFWFVFKPHGWYISTNGWQSVARMHLSSVFSFIYLLLSHLCVSCLAGYMVQGRYGIASLLSRRDARRAAGYACQLYDTRKKEPSEFSKSSSMPTDIAVVTSFSNVL